MKKHIAGKQDTGWNAVAQWYDEYLAGDDTYQAKVIAPNLLRMLAVKKGERVLDLACGQGFFSTLCAQAGAKVTGVDIAPALIAKAHESAKATEASVPSGSSLSYVTASADATGLPSAAFDAGIIVLALENIARTQETLAELSRVLVAGGRAVIVLLHPAFRIPQHADWQYSAKKSLQQRVVDRYLSEFSISILERPHAGGTHAKEVSTKTYHRSLQWYSKALRNAGFGIMGIEEWISHKKSQPGPKQKIEDAARKEFPLFIALEIRKQG